MINRLIAWSVHHAGWVYLAATALAIAGVASLARTPIDAIPDLSENQVIVLAEWPGHGPREIEDLIGHPLSLRLQGLAGVRVVRGSSDVGFAMISVIFEDDVSIRSARERVAEQLAGATIDLPDGVTPRLAPDASPTGQIFWYTVEGPNLDLGQIRSLHDFFIRPQMASVAGVAEVASVGGMVTEYQVDALPDNLRRHGVTLADVIDAVRRSNATVGSGVVTKANAEHLVRGVGWLGARVDDQETQDSLAARILADLEGSPVSPRPGDRTLLADVAHVRLGGQPRRGALEKDGNEVVGGVVLLRNGENPLEVTRRLRAKIAEIGPGLPPGVRILPCYDRMPLIEGGVGTLSRVLIEAIVTATICVVLVLRHARASLIVSLSLPLAVIGSFFLLYVLRQSGLWAVDINIMSLAGLAISVGVLVDASIVMAENVMHHLRRQFGDRPVTGDTRAAVIEACQMVGRPIVFSLAIMLVSFLPVFLLGGIEGKMFRPLAITKSLALVAVAILSVTLVPALCASLLRGRIRDETDSWIVRTTLEVYRPVLAAMIERPAILVALTGSILLLGVAPVGNRALLLSTLALAVIATAFTAATWRGRIAVSLKLLTLAFIAERLMTPLGREFMTPLDEQMVMDMPITVPRMSMTQGIDDLKARDMILCRFPEVDMVVGKLGRAESAFDPAPVDMIETMVNFRPQDLWPKRKLALADGERAGRLALDELVRAGLVVPPVDAEGTLHEAVADASVRFDAFMREYCYHRNREFESELSRLLAREVVSATAEAAWGSGELSAPPRSTEVAALTDGTPRAAAKRLAVDPQIADTAEIARATTERMTSMNLMKTDAAGSPPPGALQSISDSAWSFLTGRPRPAPMDRLHARIVAARLSHWREHVRAMNGEIPQRAAGVFSRVIVEELLGRLSIKDASLVKNVADLSAFRAAGTEKAARGALLHHADSSEPSAAIAPHPAREAIERRVHDDLLRRARWRRVDRHELVASGGEMDQAVNMPGWTNVWTMPIQNRVDMLATGVNTIVGARVMGKSLDDVVAGSESIASVVRAIPGAVDVVADPIRGKSYIEVHPDREKCAAAGVAVGDVCELVEAALAGRVVTSTVEGRARHAVRVRLASDYREDEESIGDLAVPTPSRSGVAPATTPLRSIATIRVVDGPATIKSENGLPRNYVRFNVQGRDPLDVVEEARERVRLEANLPDGAFVEWVGQYEYQAHANRRLAVILPIVVLLMFLLLRMTYNDWTDACLILLVVPAVMAGGVFFQWLMGYKFSVTIWIGYIACFGMATATGVIMLVYLRDAVARAGRLEDLSLDDLRAAVMSGAVQRLRPKLLTEATTILALAPMLWATGVGAEVIRPMAAPVFGGLLVADEVIDLALPVLFYWTRRRRWAKARAGEHNQPQLDQQDGKPDDHLLAN